MKDLVVDVNSKKKELDNYEKVMDEYVIVSDEFICNLVWKIVLMFFI